MAQPTNPVDIEAFIAQWGLDQKCRDVLSGLDAVVQQKVMSGFQPKDPSRASPMFMGFVKHVSGGAVSQAPAVGTGNIQIDAFVAQWGLDGMSQQALCNLDSQAQQRVMSSFQPTDMSRANQMFMGFVKSVAGRSGGGPPTAAQAYAGTPAGTGNAAIDGFIAQWGLDGKAQQALCSLDPQAQQRVMNDFQPTDMTRANQMFMGFVKSVAGRSGGAPTAQQAFAGGGSFSGTPEQTGNAEIDGFIAQWGLDGKSQAYLLTLDPAAQQRVMSAFQPTDMTRANQMFMGFVKSVASKGGGAPTAQQAYAGGGTPEQTGNAEIDGFIAQWGLDGKSQAYFLTLDPEAQQRVMSSFQPTDMARANQMFMGFVKSVAGRSGGAPTAQQAFSGGGTAPVETGNAEIDGFLAKWGLDGKAQSALCSLDPESQLRVMNDFQPTDTTRANQMFMGFVKSVAARSGAPTAQQAFAGSGAMSQEPSESGGDIIDGFVAQWGLDWQAKKALESLDPEAQLKVMSDFNPPDVSQASRILMGWVKTEARKSQTPTAPTAAQAFSATTSVQQPFGGDTSMPQALGGSTSAGHVDDAAIDRFVAQWGLDDQSQQVLFFMDPETQIQVLSGFETTDIFRANQRFMEFVNAVQSGASTVQQEFGGNGSIFQAPAVTGNADIAGFVAQWGLDEKAQQALSSLDPEAQLRVMNDFQPTDMSRANQMFMGFVKSVAGRAGAGRSGGGAPTAAQAYGGGGSFAGTPEQTGNADIDGFIAQWGLDGKAQAYLCTLDPAAQQRVMKDFQPTDMARANQMFMGFVKSVAGRSGGGAPTAAQAYGGGGSFAGTPEQTGNAEIDGFIAQWGLDGKAQQALCSLDADAQQRVMSAFQPTDMSRANQMFMGFVKSVAGRGGAPTAAQAYGGNRYTPY